MSFQAIFYVVAILFVILISWIVGRLMNPPYDPWRQPEDKPQHPRRRRL